MRHAPSVFVALLATVALVPGPVRASLASAPTQELRATVGRVVETLQDPALTAPERRKAIREIADGIFDWREMAKRSLGLHWRDLTEGDRGQFVRLFRELLERAYISRIERYGGETIAYGRESNDGDEATVRTTITTKGGQEVPVDYRMIRRGGRWLVYDVLIEDVSLVGNYRTQFDTIIRTSSYRELVKRMVAKVAGE